MATALKTRLLGSQSDERLSELAREGSQIAFEALARRYRRALLRRCRQLCLSQESAQEVLQRSLAEAWSGIQAGVEPQDPRSWLYGIAQRIAIEQMRGVPGASGASGVPAASAAPDGALGAAIPEPEPPGRAAAANGAPTPDEVLALRSALSAMTPRRARDGIVVHRADGNKVTEDALGIADSAVRGLLGRARRGISALTPPPLLGWALSRAAESGPSGERMAELGAGGAAGLTGLAVKGAVAALTAGVAITGAVVAQSGGHPHAGGSARLAAGARSPSSASLAVVTGPAAGSGAGTGAGGADSGAGGRSGGHSGGHRIPVASIAPPRHTSAPSGASTQGTGGSGASADGAQPSSGQSPARSQTREVRVQTSTSVTQTASAGAGSAGATGGSAGATGSSSPSVSVESSSTGSTSQSGGGSAGIGVKVSLGGESGQQGGSGGTAGGSGSSSGGSGGEPSSSSESSSTGIGISISLEPIASVGVHVSLP